MKASSQNSPDRENTGKSPLDTTFGPHSRRAKQLTASRDGILEITDSALTHLKLSTVSNLARIAERHTDALRYFPEGSKLLLSADGESGNAWESGHLNVYCELKYPAGAGSFKRSGREEFYRSGSNSTVERSFEKFLLEMQDKQLGEDNSGAL